MVQGPLNLAVRKAVRKSGRHLGPRVHPGGDIHRQAPIQRQLGHLPALKDILGDREAFQRRLVLCQERGLQINSLVHEHRMQQNPARDYQEEG